MILEDLATALNPHGEPRQRELHTRYFVNTLSERFLETHQQRESGRERERERALCWMKPLLHSGACTLFCSEEVNFLNNPIDPQVHITPTSQVIYQLTALLQHTAAAALSSNPTRAHTQTHAHGAVIKARDILLGRASAPDDNRAVWIDRAESDFDPRSFCQREAGIKTRSPPWCHRLNALFSSLCSVSEEFCRRPSSATQIQDLE